MSTRIDGYEPRIGTSGADGYTVKPFGADIGFRKKLEEEQLAAGLSSGSYSNNNVAYNWNGTIWNDAGSQNTTGGVQV